MDKTEPAGLYVRPKRWGKVEITKETDEGERVVYMRRWYIWQCQWFSVRLHHILKPDLDRDPHDHPWPFVSILLGGGYRELWCKAEDYRSIGGAWSPRHAKRVRFINWHSSTDLHRIVEFIKPAGVWSLFVTGPFQKKWGFQTSEGWVYYRDYAELVGPDPGEC